jgi:DNA-binding transcriptional LysR family regulator
VETDQLETFDRVARERSFSRAAAAMGIGQPAVSARIQSLEQALGGALFTRSRAVALTTLGEAFLPYARRVLDVLREGVGSARLAQTGQRGRVRLGALASLSGGLVGPALARFLGDHPDVDYTIHAAAHEPLLEMLADGIVDLALVAWPCAPPMAESLAPIFTFREGIVLAAHPNHALAKRGHPTADDVARLARPLVRLRLWRKPDPRITRLAEQSGTAIELPMETARKFVLLGVGAGFFARTCIAEDLAAGALVEVRPIGIDPLFRDIGLVRRRGTALSPASAEFVQALRAETERLGFKPKTGPRAR